jgi:nicotinamide riboside kinase
MIRRVNFYGGPGSGKSTTATRTFSELKTRGYSVEYVREYIKDWAYIGRPARAFDQVYVTAKQMQAEFLLLSRSVDLVICECPVLMNCVYAEKINFPGTPELIGLCKKFETEYPSLNIFLERNHPYQEWGRYENEQEANQMASAIKSFMDVHCPSYFCLPSDDLPAVLAKVLSALEPCG